MKTLLMLVSMLAASFAFAQDVGRTSGTQKHYLLGQGWGEYFGVSTGVMEQYNDEHPTAGQPNSLKIVGSHQFGDSRWVGDAGLGWQFHTLTQADNVDYKVINSLLLEGAARYQLANRWELGAMIDGIWAGDRDKYGATDRLALFAGPQVMKDFNYANTDMRFGLSALRDINIDTLTADMVLVHFQMRFGGDSNIVTKTETGSTVTAQR